MAIRTLLTLRAAEGRRDALVAHYQAHDVLSASASFGCIDGELAIDRNDPHTAVVTSRWPSVAAYEAWLASPERLDVLEQMEDLLDPRREPSITIIDVLTCVDLRSQR